MFHFIYSLKKLVEGNNCYFQLNFKPLLSSLLIGVDFEILSDLMKAFSIKIKTFFSRRLKLCFVVVVSKVSLKNVKGIKHKFSIFVSSKMYEEWYKYSVLCEFYEYSN